jgi:hypothetical protein
MPGTMRRRLISGRAFNDAGRWDSNSSTTSRNGGTDHLLVVKSFYRAKNDALLLSCKDALSRTDSAARHIELLSSAIQ